MSKPIGEQVVVITGASSGIGRCTAHHLAKKGARVVVTARRTQALETLVQEIEQAGWQALAVPADVTSEEQLKAVARGAADRFGRIDTWINNAAVYIQGRVEQITMDEYRRIIDVNLLGAINGTRCALEYMIPQNSGGIIQVSSVMGMRSSAFASPYATSKAGLEAFSGSLRTELWKTNIHVSIIYPPMVDTAIYQRGRGKFGTIPKPPPPVMDPERVAREIAVLVEHPQNKRMFGLFGRFYQGVGMIPAGIGDWFLHHVGEFALSDIPDTGDNLFEPMDEPPQIRGGWAEKGWKGLTVSEVVRVMPWFSSAATHPIGACRTFSTGADKPVPKV